MVAKKDADYFAKNAGGGVAVENFCGIMSARNAAPIGEFEASTVVLHLCICIENGVLVLWSADRDFGRFKALKTVNPLLS
jgi:hypothetical protein